MTSQPAAPLRETPQPGADHAGRVGAAGQVSATVALSGDVRRLVTFIGLHAVDGLETWDGDDYRRALRLPGGPGVLRVRIGVREAYVTVALGSMRDADVAVAAARHLLGAGEDPATADAALARDPLLAPLVSRRPGLLRPGSVDAAETLLRTVIGQQVSLGGARTVTARVVAEHGDPLPPGLRHDGGPSRCFPTSHTLAACDPASLPMPRARGRAVVALAAALAESPGVAQDDEALLALPGIGPWTVAYARLRVRRDPDVFLPTDLAVRRQLEHLGGPADPGALATRARDWAPHRSTALLQLWTDLLERRAAPTASARVAGS